MGDHKSLTNLKIFGKKEVHGEIVVPGDKSISHRAVILGSIAKGMTKVEGFLKAEDTLNTLKAFGDMGVQWRWEGESLLIYGRGREGINEPADVLDLGNSGTGLRLITGLVAGLEQFTMLTGDSSLRSRPMRRVVEPLRLMGARIDGRKNGAHAPLAVRGGKLKGIRYESPVASAQVKSAILLASLWAEGVTEIGEPAPTRDHTEIMLRAFGAEIEKKGNGWLAIKGESGETLKGREIWVPGDISSAAFFIVAALISSDSEITVKNVGLNPTRTGILEILEEMGAQLKITYSGEKGLEPVGNITACSSHLKGVAISGEKIVRAIDEFPILAVAAAFAEGKTTITGAGELRVKESDRIATMAKELAKMGARVEELPDGMTISGGVKLHGTTVSSHGDHRVAMSLAIAGLAIDGETVVEDTACIATSFPGFDKLLEKVTA